MPPQLSHSHLIVTPKTQLLVRVSPKSRFKQILYHKYCQQGRGGRGGRMKFTKRKLIPVLVFILCTASIFRFLNISMITSSSAPLQPPVIHHHECSSGSSICRKNVSRLHYPSKGSSSTNASSSLTDKEMRFLLKFFSRRVPCNLLVFGLEYQYSSIASLNAGGITIFLVDNLHNTRAIKSTKNNTQVRRITYKTLASEAYQLLKDARKNPNCLPKFYLPKVSKCNLALPNLPQQVYDTMWDVVMVDGPSGDSPDSLGRMASIYMASILARRGNTSHVMVHDVDRMIEKWYSWEFLCEENLVSSNGRFWHFQILGLGVTNATTFCTP